MRSKPSSTTAIAVALATVLASAGSAGAGDAPPKAAKGGDVRKALDQCLDFALGKGKAEPGERMIGAVRLVLKSSEQGRACEVAASIAKTEGLKPMLDLLIARPETFTPASHPLAADNDRKWLTLCTVAGGPQLVLTFGAGPEGQNLVGAEVTQTEARDARC